MEDQTSWKGHTFTLLVFTGIVVLCSIFFILGMLVGRAQGQKLVANAPVDGSAKNEVKTSPKGQARARQGEAISDDRPDLTFYESKREDSTLQAAPLKPASAPGPPPVETPKEKPAAAARAAEKPAPAPTTVINWQIAAVRTDADAQKLLDQVKKKGFRGFILAPAEGESNPYFRVQVGPFSDVIEAQNVKKKLEEAKYQPILKK
jgi:cell division septation protein DedD